MDACQDASVDIIFLCETYHKRGHLPCAWTQYHNYAARGDGDSHFVKFGLSFLVRPQLPYEVHQVLRFTARVGPRTADLSGMRRPGYHARPVLSESIIDFFLSMPDNLFDPRMKIHTGLGLSHHHLCELSFVPVNMSRLPAATAQRLTWNLQRLKKPAILDRYQTRSEELPGALLGDIRTCLNAK
ncbi:hypothetical protein VTP01DRAFT_7262, partial [Rhizomucor pusillus]|uniref:uncharacterized protein n=1 Tax=Rhizomucor pusillus TaxID=4840 RepID=UPI003743BD23